jgi:hypothetical protein
LLWFGERGAQVGKLSKFMPQQSKETSGKRWSDSIHSLQFKFIHQNMSSCSVSKELQAEAPKGNIISRLKVIFGLLLFN